MLQIGIREVWFWSSGIVLNEDVWGTLQIGIIVVWFWSSGIILDEGVRETLHEVYSASEIGTRERKDSLICAYSRNYSQELVYQTRSAKRDKRLGRIDQELQGNV
jgi:hypothetical protein